MIFDDMTRAEVVAADLVWMNSDPATKLPRQLQAVIDSHVLHDSSCCQLHEA